MGLSDKEQSVAYPVVYPSVESGGEQAYNTVRWGTYTMGNPSKPEDHPQNKQAATWEPLPSNVVDQGDHMHFYGQQPSSSSTGYTYPPATGTANPYVITSPASGSTGKSPMDVIQEYFNKWRQKFEEIAKKAEIATGNVWQHLKTGPNMADTAWGRLSQGTRLLSEGGFENVYRQTFQTAPDEQLLKTYACYLSTSAGPVAGTLYISSRQIAFCSDRPLSYQPALGQTAWSYYKVVVPVDRLQVVTGTSSSQNASEKYIKIQTTDGFEFWFMGFVNYDKAIRNLQAAQVQSS